MFRSFARFWLSPTVKNWRDLRRLCMKRLPKKESPTDIIEFIEEMAEKTEAFFQLANGPMKDYLKYLNTTEKPRA